MHAPAPPDSPPRLLWLGDCALTVEFGSAIDERIHARVIGFTRALELARGRGELAGLVEWAPAFRSVSLFFDAAAACLDDPAALAAALLDLARAAPAVAESGRRWRIPVCFDDGFAPDLDGLAEARGLGREQVVALLTGCDFRVYMLGFLPGFPYLGGLPAACELPRRATPRSRVPERSLAVAGRMCAVYPWESPGGWHLLGRTPLRLFDAAAAEPALLRAGDQIRWSAIDRATYAELDRLAADGRLERGRFLVSDEVAP